MKTMGKVICCILAAALFLYLMVWDYPHFKEKLNSEASAKTGFESLHIDGGEESAAGDDGNADVNSTADDLKKQAEVLEKQIKELEEQQASSGCVIHPFFDQVFESCYEQLYPLMKQMGYTGTLVLTDGQLPGDYLQMTEAQCKEMLDNGWELAVGGSEEIDLTESFESIKDEWSTYLEEYLVDIKLRLNVVPTVYCFNEGEYREEFDEILKSYGFTTIRYFGEEALQGEADGLTRIRGYRVSQGTDIDQAVADLSGYSTAALCTRRVTDDVEDDSQNMEINKYKELLNSVDKADGLYIAGSAAEKKYQEAKEALAKQIEKLKAQKEVIEQQLNEDN